MDLGRTLQRLFELLITGLRDESVIEVQQFQMRQGLQRLDTGVRDTGAVQPQLFEILGLDQTLVARFFPGTASPVISMSEKRTWCVRPSTPSTIA